MLFLIVDDDALSRELLTLLLEAEGYEVEAVASGEEAVTRAAASHLPPDVILTDIQMPGLAGDALATSLREALPDKRTLLLAMSGSQPGDAALQRFDGFLLKPFQISELKSLISAPGTYGLTAKEIVDASVFDQETPVIEVLDEDIYTKLGELMPVEQLGQMYALCVSDARKRIDHMRTLAEAGDDAQYRSEAHTVKGGSGMIGARQLYELAAAAEHDGIPASKAVSGTSSVTSGLAQLSLACDRLERILEERTRE